ncbi:hypothetical protein [Oryza sativa Japonica Group]|uniref:Uncharacterized protein n=1 Tax=Oryza sativa subsp. japonica TaxID=39947 RepID=Q5ZCQ1_ORYSJ|nr:hypothetical protein [Oryza sativa Japonica Group]
MSAAEGERGAPASGAPGLSSAQGWPTGHGDGDGAHALRAMATGGGGGGAKAMRRRWR